MAVPLKSPNYVFFYFSDPLHFLDLSPPQILMTSLSLLPPCLPPSFFLPPFHLRPSLLLHSHRQKSFPGTRKIHPFFPPSFLLPFEFQIRPPSPTRVQKGGGNLERKKKKKGEVIASRQTRMWPFLIFFSFCLFFSMCVREKGGRGFFFSVFRLLKCGQSIRALTTSFQKENLSFFSLWETTVLSLPPPKKKISEVPHPPICPFFCLSPPLPHC